MLQQGILNPAILHLIARVRHTNTLVVADWAFPYWPEIETVDISLTQGIPTILQLLELLKPNFKVGRILQAEEFLSNNPKETVVAYNSSFLDFSGALVERPSHIDFKRLVPGAIGLIRTGDTTRYRKRHLGISLIMRTAITISQVAESAAGPFVFHAPLAESFELAKQTGFDDVELFLPGPEHVSVAEIKALSESHGVGIAAIGTGAGMVRHGLSLTDPSLDRRVEALDFLERMIAFGGQFGAPAILGSMQGKWGGEVSRDQALEWLSEALLIAGRTASKYNVPFIYEPLNRYETNLINRLGDGAGFIEAHSLENVVLLADLFHMNIEEADIPASIRASGNHIGHVHYADSNRHAFGFGHTDPAPIIAALQEMNYIGRLSAEIFPLPDARTAAEQTIRSIRSFQPPESPFEI